MSNMQQPMEPGEEKLPAQQPANLTPVIDGLERPATVFLSYARADTEAIKELQLRLNARGVLCKLDTDYLLSGSSFESEIVRTIEHDADAIVLLLTLTFLKSDFIREVEVPAALRRQARDPHFHVIPVLWGISIDDFKQYCLDHDVANLTHFQVISPNDHVTTNMTKESQTAQWNDVAKRILQTALTLHLRRIGADRSYEPWIYLKTFSGISPTQRLDLNLDWLTLVYKKERIPTPQEWTSILLPALLDVKDSISEQVPSYRLHVFAQCILPVAIALGFAFLETTGITLLIEGQKETWSTATPSAGKDPLHVEWLDTNQGNQSDAVVEVATTRSTKQGVMNSLPVIGLNPSHHVRLESPEPSRESVKDAAYAQAIAQQVGHICQELCDRRGVTHIHLFVAIPVQLAILIGQQLNALCPITLYQYGAQMVYQPAGTLA